MSVTEREHRDQDYCGGDQCRTKRVAARGRRDDIVAPSACSWVMGVTRSVAILAIFGVIILVAACVRGEAPAMKSAKVDAVLSDDYEYEQQEPKNPDDVSSLGVRRGGRKARALVQCGGSKDGLNAVDAALRWFKKHQSPNGQWSVAGYPNNCTENPKCEPGAKYTDIQGDVACTGYALLCFLGAGYDHKMPSKYKLTVKKGIDWLVSVQKDDGRFGERNHEHAVATMALAEALAMSNDPVLKDPAQRAVDVLVSRQSPDPKNHGGLHLGWNFVEPTVRRIDSRITGEVIMALKSAAAAGLNVGNSLEGAKAWCARAWTATNAGAMPKDIQGDSRFPATWSPKDDVFLVGRVGSDKNDLSSIGGVCAAFLGYPPGDLMRETLCNYSMNHQVPASYPANTYYLYYNTLAIFQIGGDRWEKWNGTVRDLLIGAQRKSQDCFDGSWDFEGTKFYGYETGRLLSTAFCCLSLEVYYRYPRMNLERVITR